MRILLVIIILFSPLALSANNINLRDTDKITVMSEPRNLLDDFINGRFSILEFFYAPSYAPGAVENSFYNIAFGVKNFFVTVAVIFLLIGILKLLFSGGEEEKVKKWKQNIIWVSIGVFAMQIAFPIWRTLFLRDSTYTGNYVDGRLAWTFWINIFEPVVGVILLLSSLAFLAMAVYAFYTMITAAGDEEKAKKGKNIVIYAIVGFLLIRIPKMLVSTIYGTPGAACGNTNSIFTIGVCVIEKQNLGGTISIFGKILTYISGFLGIVAVALVIYAGFIVFTSAGEEERLKKAKNIVIWIAIGFVLLVASHAIFRFFFLRG